MFDKQAFTKQNFEHRTETIPVPALADWFDGNPEWVIRNLTGSELVIAQEAVAKNKNISALAEALVTSNNADKVEALRSIIGTSDDVPGELAKRLEMLVFSSVEPEIDMAIGVKLAENFPVEFMQLTNKVIVLTGLGASSAKQKPSGKIPRSEAV